MKPLICMAVAIVLCTGSIAGYAQPAAKKHIQVTYNRTIETIMILRAISSDDHFFKRVDSSFKGRPMLYRARQYFAAYRNHPAVAKTQAMLDSTRDIGGILFQGVLYAEELPASGLRYEPELPYWKVRKKELINYMLALAQFYREANVAQFLAENKSFYDGAINEAKSHMNDEVITAMETYFGKKNNSYTLLILPMSPYGWGFSATTGNTAKNQYAIVSPVGNTEWHDDIAVYKAYGFSGEEARAHYSELVTHEFTHSFITDLLNGEALRKQINSYDSLYTTALDNAMQEQGYGDWWGFVNEYIVRLGEIRVAAQLDTSEANYLREVNINEYKFVLLPEGETLMQQYERNRVRYKTIDSFLPVVIKQFQQYNKQIIDDKLKKTVFK